MDDGLWMMDYGLWIMDYGLWIMDYGLWIMDYGFFESCVVRYTVMCDTYMKGYMSA